MRRGNGESAAPAALDGALARLQRVAEGVSRVGAVVGGALLMLAAITICVDIVLRYAFTMTVGGADELAGYALAIASAIGFSVALLGRSHIRIDTVYVRVGSRLRGLLDLASVACLALFVALVAFHAWGVVEQSYVSGSRSLSELETPLIVPQSVWFAALCFFVVAASLLLVRGLIAYLRGDLARLFQLIGSKSTLAEAEEEAQATAQAMQVEQRR
jgi:TRAP-type C4-dicarboxylate transport system permease small subunit